MVKFKQILIIMVLAGALVLSGCSGSSDGDLDTTSPGAYFGGSEGADVSFEPFSIIEEGIYTIFDSEDFPIEVVLSNPGEHDLEVGDVRLELLGPAEADFSGIPSWELSNSEAIEGISEFNPEGGEEIISFTPSDYALYTADVVGYNDLTWHLNYEYDYETQLIVNDVCFKEDSADDRVCTVDEGKVYSVSGAPITVTSGSEDSGGRGIILLKIDISNVNTGESTIVGEDFDDRFSQVAFEISDPTEWECKSGGREGEARLVDGEASIVCRLVEPLEEDTLYEASVSMAFSYTYRDIIQESLRVKESAE